MGGDSSFQFDYDSWYYIYQKLNSITYQNSFGLTCSTFRHIQNSTSRKSLKIQCSNNDYIIDSSIIDKLLSRHTKLETLSLGCPCPSFDLGCRHITYSCLTPLLKYGSTLRSLYFEYSCRITDTELTLVASACPLLSVISLTNTSISDRGLEFLSDSCKSLEELNLSACRDIFDYGILSLYRNCRQLRALRISGCWNIRGSVGFREFSPTLTCFEAFNCEFDPTAISQIVSGGGLWYLNLGASLFNHFPPIDLGFVSKLKFLNTSNCSFVDDDFILKISRGCPLLQEWKLSKCNMIGIFGWESIGLYCQNLETLHVGYCDGLCNKGLLSIADGCKRLSVIFIELKCISQEGHLFRSLRQDVEFKTHVSFEKAPSWAYKT